MAKTIRTVISVQHNGVEVTDKQIMAKIKKVWTESGKLVKDLDAVDIYVKPAEDMVYYVIEGDTYKVPISEVLEG